MLYKKLTPKTPFGSIDYKSLGYKPMSCFRALNYGAIGTILGHELTHGFDNSGEVRTQ